MRRMYRALMALVALVASGLVRLPALRGHRERLEGPSQELRDRLRGRRTLWIHAASVGEVLATVPLVRALGDACPGHAIVLSTTSLAGRKLAGDVAGVEGAFLLPIDAPRVVERTLDALRPEALVLTETEIWPTLLEALERRGVPVALVSGRISERAYPRYRWLLGLLRPALTRIARFGMQGETEAARIRALGAPESRVTVTGSLKVDRPIAVPAELAVAGEARIWIAGSTRPGEEEVCLAAFGSLRKEFPTLRLLLAPRHLERCDEVEALVRRAGLVTGRRSRENGAWPPDVPVLVLDTLGDLARLYPHAYVAFVGGTLVPVGGHNLLEPARCGVPVVYGPHVANVVGIAEALERAGGGRRVANGRELEEVLRELLADPGRRDAMGDAAAGAIPPGEVVTRTVALVEEVLRRT